MNDIVEKDIIEKAAGGDLAAFESIYRNTAELVYNVAFGVLRNNEEAEEITQEVFLKVHDKLKYFKGRSSFKTWIYRITMNAAITRYKKIAKERERNVELDENIEIPVQLAKHALDEEHEKITVNAMLGELNPDQKACVVLRELEGLSYKEISDTLKIGINTVRTRLKRAREKFLDMRRGGVKNEM